MANEKNNLPVIKGTINCESNTNDLVQNKIILQGVKCNDFVLRWSCGLPDNVGCHLLLNQTLIKKEEKDDSII